MSSVEPQPYTRLTGCPTQFFTLCIVRSVKTGKFLAVEEVRNKGWWLPGGFVEPGDDVFQTAHKEAKEEADMELKLKGFLRFDCTLTKFKGRARAVFYAEPLDEDHPPKSIADAESVSAKW